MPDVETYYKTRYGVSRKTRHFCYNSSPNRFHRNPGITLFIPPIVECLHGFVGLRLLQFVPCSEVRVEVRHAHTRIVGAWILRVVQRVKIERRIRPIEHQDFTDLRCAFRGMLAGRSVHRTQMPVASRSRDFFTEKVRDRLGPFVHLGFTLAQTVLHFLFLTPFDT